MRAIAREGAGLLLQETCPRRVQYTRTTSRDPNRRDPRDGSRKPPLTRPRDGMCPGGPCQSGGRSRPNGCKSCRTHTRGGPSAPHQWWSNVAVEWPAAARVLVSSLDLVATIFGRAGAPNLRPAGSYLGLAPVKHGPPVAAAVATTGVVVGGERPLVLGSSSPLARQVRPALHAPLLGEAGDNCPDTSDGPRRSLPHPTECV